MTPEQFYEKIVKKIDEICRLVIETIKDQIDRKYGCFELFGLDFLLDEYLNPHLIEINTNPAIFTDTVVQKEMIPKLVKDVCKLAVQLHPAGKKDGSEQLKKFMEMNMMNELQLPYKIIYQEWKI